MSDLLHFPAQHDAPIACDMSTASDTPEERLAEYDELFTRALARRERGDDSVAFAFRDEPGVRDQVDDLARREAACCPFLDIRVETVDDHVVFTFAGGLNHPASAAARMSLVSIWRLSGSVGDGSKPNRT